MLLIGLSAAAAPQRAGAGRPVSPRCESSRAEPGARQRGARGPFDGELRRERRHAALRRWLRSREILRRLEVTPEQRELAREAAAKLRPLADELRPQVRDVLGRARELRRTGDARGAARLREAELRPLRERTRSSALPEVEPLLRSLTPEQRATLERAARARGRELDEQRLARRLALRLARRVPRAPSTPR
jgi:hypothetical protein